MCEVGADKIFHDPALLWLAGKVMREFGSDMIFLGASITVIGWHGYG